jgi:hypothetical protein
VTPELLSLVVNLITLVMIFFERPFNEGRVLYWFGATMLTLGLIQMRKP